MRRQWFGDSRDYVKWSCIRHEAQGGYLVLYALMLREDSFSGEGLDPDVKEFFDRQKDFNKLGELFTRFHLFDRPYSGRTAAEYFQALEEKLIEVRGNQRVLLFLDPDTGIEPDKECTDVHLKRSHVVKLCRNLQNGDKLVVYQHASRKSGWEHDWKRKLATIVADTGCEVGEPYLARDTAKDVCFFTFSRPL